MAVTKILLLATGTAAVGLMVGSVTPNMKPAPEPYWAGVTPYDPSEQGEGYSVTQVMPEDLNPGVPIDLASFYASGDQRYAEKLPLYVSVEPVNQIELVELQAEPGLDEQTAIEAEQAAASAEEAANEVQAHLASEPDAV